MSRRPVETILNASTVDILNVIRQNAPYEYQSLVPAVTQATDIPKVGEVLFGHPAMANIFLNALIGRIALVRVKSATFNNAYAELKKGYLEFGETVEEVFVQIAKAREFSAEKAASREFARTIPDVRSAFHTINWRVQYPVTIQNEDLRTAFTSINGVEDLIARIIDSVYTAEQYDEFLLFKYLIIKGVAHGKMKAIGFDGSDIKNAAVVFRGTSNKLPFMSTEYNDAGVHTTTPKEDQYIFMDASYNADYDVNVLASAFNMDKADFMGKLKLIDDFTSFDNDRFDTIRAASDGIEEVSASELSIMNNVKAILIDREWFQVYDNLTNFTEDYVAAGMYWNYFFNIYKTVSSSPFSNAVVFVDTSVPVAPDSVTVKVMDKSTNGTVTVLTLAPVIADAGIGAQNYAFEQNSALTTAGVGVQKYGVFLIPNTTASAAATMTMGGRVYTGGTNISYSLAVGDTIIFTADDYISDQLTALTIGGLTLSPTFAKGTYTYTTTTTNSTNTITATGASGATVVIKNGDTTITSGQSATWAAGANTVTVTCTGFVDGAVSTKTYTVTVTKS